MRTESSPTSRPERNQPNTISSAGHLAKASASAAIASVSGLAIARPGLRKWVGLPARRPREGGGVVASPLRADRQAHRYNELRAALVAAPTKAQQISVA